MDEPYPPIVWLPHLDHGAELLAWTQRPSGWWASVSCTSSTNLGRSYTDGYAHWTLTVHESLVQPRKGADYSRVPRIAST